MYNPCFDFNVKFFSFVPKPLPVVPYSPIRYLINKRVKHLLVTYA